MKKVIAIAMAVLVMLALVSCNERDLPLIDTTEDPSVDTDPWGITLSIKDITNKGLTLVCSRRDGNATGELQTGSPYFLEVYDDGGWISVEAIDDENVTWTMIAISIPEGRTEWQINWESIYGELAAGRYRIGKEITDFRGPGDFEKQMYYAEFELGE